MEFGKLPQRIEEALFLCNFEVVVRNALINPFERTKGGPRSRWWLTRSKISMHNSASLRSKFKIKVLPSLSVKIPARVLTALASSRALVTSLHSRW